MTFSEKLETYLSIILNFNWKNFNELDMREQSSNWQALLNEFDSIIRKEHQLNSLDFESIHTMINTYEKRFKKLPIKGKYYTIINKILISGRLHGFVRDLEFEDAQKSSTAICDCELLSKFSKQPNTSNLKKIKTIDDGYYNLKLLKCKKCNFQWISYISDDSTGNIGIEKHVEEK